MIVWALGFVRFHVFFWKKIFFLVFLEKDDRLELWVFVRFHDFFGKKYFLAIFLEKMIVWSFGFCEIS